MKPACAHYRFITTFPVVSFITLTFSLSWGSWSVFRLIQSAGVQPAIHYTIITQFSPAIAALILIIFTEGSVGLEQIASRLVKWRVGAGWLLLAFLFEPLLFGSFCVIYWLVTGELHIAPVFRLGSGLSSLFSTFLIGLFRWGFSEEVGWRGWMLPKLQAGMTPLKAALVMSLVITLWHFPPDAIPNMLTVRPGDNLQGFYPPFLERLIITIPIVMLVTHIFNRTNGSLLPQVIYHSASNSSYFWIESAFGITRTPIFKTAFLVAVILLGIVMAGILLKQNRGVTCPSG